MSIFEEYGAFNNQHTIHIALMSDFEQIKINYNEFYESLSIENYFITYATRVAHTSV